MSWTKLDKAQGAPGENGQNGKDGVTPQLKIAEGYWYVSYDDGQTWIELYKAQGESGAPGKDGEDGKDGDSFFKNVVIGDYDVTFTLADGSEFTLPLGKPAFEFADSDPQAITTERNQVCILINEISEEASFIAGIEACDAVISTKAGRKWDAKLSFSENKDTLIVDVTPDGENPRAILTITRLLPGSSHSISKILENHDPISLATSEPANCYIVPHSGYYRFPAVYGNDIANTVTDINQVDVLWESYGTDIAPQAGDLVSDAIYEKGYISFFSSDKKGNAVIAARDKSGTILWSWHIWMTDEPEDQKYQGGVTMMDRNLGAVSAKPNDVGSFGLFYQWGRKDPFLGSSSTIGIIKEEDRIFPRALSCPNDIWEDTESDEYHGTVSFAVENPTCFIRYNDDNYDWYYTGDESTDKTRWAEWTKTVFDPCPPGYVVPPGGNYGVWSYPLYWTGQFDVGNIETVFDYSLLGLDFAYDGSRPYLTYSADVCWYPFTGYISESDAEIREVGQSSYLWSSTMYYSGDEQYFPYTFTISPWSIQLASVDDLAYGQTVRCVKFVNGLS